MLDEGQSRELGRFLNARIHDRTLEHRGATLAARVLRVVDIGSSGFPFHVRPSPGDAATPAALGEAIAQRLNRIVRAGESARDCNDKRMKGQIPAATDAAKKALSTEPDLPAAHLCLATVYENPAVPPTA